MIVWGQDVIAAEGVLRVVKDLSTDALAPAFSGAIVMRSERPIGAVLYTGFSPTNLYMHCAFSGPMTRGDIAELLGFAYGWYGVERITAAIAKTNRRSRDFAKRLGFVQEGKHPSALPPDRPGSNARTLITYGLLKGRCRWLGHPRSQAWRVHFDEVRGAA